MEKTSLMESQGIAKVGIKRFRHSPYYQCYANAEAVWGIYVKRLYPLSLGEDTVSRYWNLRQKVVLYDVPERPIEIVGPDAVRLLERVFCRTISTLVVGRVRYAIACAQDGGILMDGVLIRLADDHFWYVQADGDFDNWLAAQALGLAVTVGDPDSWVLQVQGPRALDLLATASDEGLAEKLGFFHARKFRFGGQELLVTRTGWTNELGFEVYTSGDDTDGPALWRHLMAAGEQFGMVSSALDSMIIRRIEAGIFDNGTDLDPTLTPYAAGLGRFVDLDKADFIGRDALSQADQRPQLHGLKCPSIAPASGWQVQRRGAPIGQISAGVWSPYLGCGIGYVRLNNPDHDLTQPVTLIDPTGGEHTADIVALPFYDEAKEIPRGLNTTIPSRPAP